MTNIQTGIEDMAYRMIEHTVFDGTYRPYLPYNRSTDIHIMKEVQPKIEPTVRQVIKLVSDFHNVDLKSVGIGLIASKLEARFDIHDEQEQTSYDAHLLEVLHQR